MNNTAQIDVRDYMQTVGKQAREAGYKIAQATTEQKNDALKAIGKALLASQDAILEANQKDLDAGKQNGLDAALMDRLALNEDRIAAMVEGLEQVATLPDPVGEVDIVGAMDSGIHLSKMRVPLGVIGIIYESRPNVTADAAALCLKSGNAAILRGGSESLHSNTAIAAVIKTGLEEAGLDSNVIQVVKTTDRAAVGELITMQDYVDVIVPRGGKGLIERISTDARVPVIKHLDGICHVYIDAECDEKKAFDIALNAKTHRYGVCNAMETLLVNASVAQTVLPALLKAYKDKDVEIRACEQTLAIDSSLNKATEEDWSTEYLAPIISIKIVDGVDAAIEHINHYGSHHTDSIVTENLSAAAKFLAQVDSSSVMHNASTRFADGFEYGLGAEIGISTDKIHVRGPVGLVGLTTQKYIVKGNGTIRQ